MILGAGLNITSGLVVTGGSGSSIVTNGLILNLDAANSSSYPGTGTTWFDLSPSGYNSTLINNPAYTADPGNFTFDKVDDYVQVTTNGFGKFNHQSFTVSTWFKPTVITGSDSPLFSYDYTSHNPPYYSIHLRQDQTGGLFFGWNDNGSYSGGVTTLSKTTAIPAANVWYCATAVFTAGRQELWVNNSIVDSKTQNHTIIFYNQPVWLGKTNWGVFIRGGMSTMHFYNRALSSAEITQNFNALRGRYGV